MLRVLPSTFQPVLQQVMLQGCFFSWVVKRATLLFNSFCGSRQTSCTFFVSRFTVTQVVHVVNITPFLLDRSLEQSEGEYDSVQ